jgi:hypothetical protein
MLDVLDTYSCCPSASSSELRSITSNLSAQSSIFHEWAKESVQVVCRSEELSQEAGKSLRSISSASLSTLKSLVSRLRRDVEGNKLRVDALWNRLRAINTSVISVRDALPCSGT